MSWEDIADPIPTGAKSSWEDIADPIPAAVQPTKIAAPAVVAVSPSQASGMGDLSKFYFKPFGDRGSEQPGFAGGTGAAIVGAGQGLTGNLVKYPVAGAAYLIDKAKHGDASMTWEQAKQYYNDAVNATAEAHPISHGVGELGGSIYGAKLSPMGVVPTSVLQGGAQGYSQNEDLTGAGIGAGIGLGAGLAGKYVLGPAARYLSSKIGGKFASTTAEDLGQHIQTAAEQEAAAIKNLPAGLRSFANKPNFDDFLDSALVKAQSSGDTALENSIKAAKTARFGRQMFEGLLEKSSAASPEVNADLGNTLGSFQAASQREVGMLPGALKDAVTGSFSNPMMKVRVGAAMVPALKAKGTEWMAKAPGTVLAAPGTFAAGVTNAIVPTVVPSAVDVQSGQYRPILAPSTLAESNQSLHDMMNTQ